MERATTETETVAVYYLGGKIEADTHTQTIGKVHHRSRCRNKTRVAKGIAPPSTSILNDYLRRVILDRSLQCSIPCLVVRVCVCGTFDYVPPSVLSLICPSQQFGNANIKTPGGKLHYPK